jgi:hypothetical protein
MDARVLLICGRVAGIGGIALGILLLVFAKILAPDFFASLGLSPSDSFRLVMALMVFTFGIGATGLVCWVIAGAQNHQQRASTPQVLLVCGLLVLILGVATIVGRPPPEPPPAPQPQVAEKQSQRKSVVDVADKRLNPPAPPPRPAAKSVVEQDIERTTFGKTATEIRSLSLGGTWDFDKDVSLYKYSMQIFDSRYDLIQRFSDSERSSELTATRARDARDSQELDGTWKPYYKNNGIFGNLDDVRQMCSQSSFTGLVSFFFNSLGAPKEPRRERKYNDTHCIGMPGGDTCSHELIVRTAQFQTSNGATIVLTHQADEVSKEREYFQSEYSRCRVSIKLQRPS